MKKFPTLFIKTSALAAVLILANPPSLRAMKVTAAEDTELRKALELVEKLKIEMSEYQRKGCLAECKDTPPSCWLGCETAHKQRVIYSKQDTQHAKSYLNLAKIWQDK